MPEATHPGVLFKVLIWPRILLLLIVHITLGWRLREAHRRILLDIPVSLRDCFDLLLSRLLTLNFRITDVSFHLDNPVFGLSDSSLNGNRWILLQVPRKTSLKTVSEISLSDNNESYINYLLFPFPQSHSSGLPRRQYDSRSDPVEGDYQERE